MINLRSIHKRISARITRNTRAQEIKLVIDCLKPYLNQESPRLNILEFGAGNCYQAKELRKIGSVTASDTKLGELRDQAQGVSLVISSMEDSPFKSHSFDLIFSNHVLEHIANLSKALAEADRAGKADALFAFTVPTRLWLLLAQPAMVGWRIAGLVKSWPQEGGKAFAGLFRLGTHGEYSCFSEEYKAYGVSNWSSLLEINGFLILERVPLLFYAPAELLLPSSRSLVRLGLCSSMLFILKRAK